MRPGLIAALFATLLIGIAAVRSGRTPALPPGATHLVVIEGMKFSPATLRIRAGERVIFKNNDLVPHTVTSKEKDRFDSGSLKAGESWSLTFKTQGRFPFRCSFHPMMEGEILVAGPE